MKLDKCFHHNVLERIKNELEQMIKSECKYMWEFDTALNKSLYSSRNEYIEIATREFIQSIAHDYGMMK